jgi:hypothetical protein
MPEEQPTFVEQVLQFIEQLVTPDWGDLMALVPLLLVAIVAFYLLHTAWQWRRAGERTRPRVPARLAGGAPPPGVHLPGPSRWPFVVPIGGGLILFALVLPQRDEAGQVTMPFNVPLFALGLLVTFIALAGWLIEAMREWRATAEGGHATAGPLEAGHAVAALPAGGEAAQYQPPAEPPPGVHMPGPSPWPFFAPIGMALILFGLILSWWLVLGGLVLAVIAAAGWYREASHEYRSTEEVGHAVPKTRDPAKAWPRRMVGVFVTVVVVSVLFTLAPLGAEWLRGLGPPPPGEETPPAVPAEPEIVARSAVSFETDLLVVPCCRDFELIFRNEHAGVPHDVVISDGPERATDYFDGELITGVETITYQVPALDEGDYYFLCSIHPNMNGTVQARPEEPGAEE